MTFYDFLWFRKWKGPTGTVAAVPLTKSTPRDKIWLPPWGIQKNSFCIACRKFWSVLQYRISMAVWVFPDVKHCQDFTATIGEEAVHCSLQIIALMASRFLRRRSVALSHCRTVPKICCVLQVSKVTLRSIEHWEDTLSVSVTLRHCSYPNLSHFVCCEILFQTQQRFVQLRDWNSGKQNMWEIPCWETCCVGNVWKCQVSTGKVQA